MRGDLLSLMPVGAIEASLSSPHIFRKAGSQTIQRTPMKIINACLMAVSAALLAACAAPVRQPYTPSVSAPQVPASLEHRYAVIVKGSSGDAIQGAAVKFTPKKGSSTAQAADCITDSAGRCEFTMNSERDPQYRYVNSYTSTVEYKVSKDGYYSKSGSVVNVYDGKIGRSLVERPVSLYVPDDYMAAGFGKTPVDRELREKAIRFLALIQIESLLNEAEVPLRAVDVSDFKGRKYFRLKLNSTTHYNSLKLDKYAVGKRLFDESLRKVLNPLNEHISNPKAFYGYDLVIDGYSKSFADKDARPEKIEYRFLMPQDAVRKYKDKDISGQQLLDASVILMNDERIDMKLQ